MAQPRVTGPPGSAVTGIPTPVGRIEPGMGCPPPAPHGPRRPHPALRQPRSRDAAPRRGTAAHGDGGWKEAAGNVCDRSDAVVTWVGIAVPLLPTSPPPGPGCSIPGPRSAPAVMLGKVVAARADCGQGTGGAPSTPGPDWPCWACHGTVGGSLVLALSPGWSGCAVGVRGSMGDAAPRCGNAGPLAMPAHRGARGRAVPGSALCRSG